MINKEYTNSYLFFLPDCKKARILLAEDIKRQGIISDIPYVVSGICSQDSEESAVRSLISARDRGNGFNKDDLTAGRI